MQRNIILLNLVVLLVIVNLEYNLVEAKELHVPADAPTIQAGINAANSGDVVVVAPGLYNESIELKSGVAVLGAGPNVTTIRASFPLSAVSARDISSGKIDGFQIDRHIARAGILCLSSSLTISNNLITSSFSRGDEFGIMCNWGSHPLITGNTIRRHAAGIACAESSSPVISHNIISASVPVSFGIVCIRSSSPKIAGNEITGGVGIRIAEEAHPAIGGSLAEANDIYATKEAIRNETRSTIHATYNYWGTVEEARIKALIFDSDDDVTNGPVIYSPWTDKLHTQVLGSAPAVPVLRSPLNGERVASLTPILEWHASEGAASYTIQIATDKQFTEVIHEVDRIVGIEYQVPEGRLRNSITYYWRLNAISPAGTSDWSTVNSFKVEAERPSALVKKRGKLPTVWARLRN